ENNHCPGHLRAHTRHGARVRCADRHSRHDPPRQPARPCIRARRRPLRCRGRPRRQRPLCIPARRGALLRHHRRGQPLVARPAGARRDRAAIDRGCHVHRSHRSARHRHARHRPRGREHRLRRPSGRARAVRSSRREHGHAAEVHVRAQLAHRCGHLGARARHQPGRRTGRLQPLRRARGTRLDRRGRCGSERIAARIDERSCLHHRNAALAADRADRCRAHGCRARPRWLVLRQRAHRRTVRRWRGAHLSRDRRRHAGDLPRGLQDHHRFRLRPRRQRVRAATCDRSAVLRRPRAGDPHCAQRHAQRGHRRFEPAHLGARRARRFAVCVQQRHFRADRRGAAHRAV
ncbi:MAG: hypothetical protein AVDCRST_MAG71-622, partial [uncultured Lysobacter sp.]